MKFFAVLSVLSSIAALTTAAAVPAKFEERSLESIEKRANLGVYVCTDRNWQGHCVHIVAPERVCGELNHREDIQRLLVTHISSPRFRS